MVNVYLYTYFVINRLEQEIDELETGVPLKKGEQGNENVRLSLLNMLLTKFAYLFSLVKVLMPMIILTFCHMSSLLGT